MVALRTRNGNGEGSRPFAVTHDPNQLFREMVRDFARGPIEWTRGTSVPPANVRETAEKLIVELDLPGHRLEDIEVSLEKDVLTVKSVRRIEHGEGEMHHRSELSYGEYLRSFALPATVDADRIEARYEAGVLRVDLPKRDEVKPRTIQVKAS